MNHLGPPGWAWCSGENFYFILRWPRKPLFWKGFSNTRENLEEKQWRVRAYVWDWHCRRRCNKWMALRRWLPVWQQATPTCHSQISANGRWLSTWSSANICFRISKPNWRQQKGWIHSEVSLNFTDVCTDVEDSTCLETSSAASCNGKLVAPLCVAQVWHESVVQGVTWEKPTYRTGW